MEMCDIGRYILWCNHYRERVTTSPPPLSRYVSLSLISILSPSLSLFLSFSLSQHWILPLFFFSYHFDSLLCPSLIIILIFLSACLSIRLLSSYLPFFLFLLSSYLPFLSFFHLISFYLPSLINIIYSTGMLLLFVLMGAFAGFTSARLYKTFKGRLPHSHSISQSHHFINLFVRTYSSNIVRTCCLHLLHYLPLPIFIKFIRPLLSNRRMLDIEPTLLP